MKKYNKPTFGVKETNEDMDQKWGYMVCFGTIITIISGTGHINSFGLIFHDFIVDTHSSSKSLTTAFGVFGMTTAIGGLVLNSIQKRFSLREGGLLGSLLFVSGSFATMLISNAGQLILTFGVMQGIGFGIMVPVCYSMINQYFVKKRTTVMSICKATQGIIQIVYPQAMKEMMAEFGLRATLLALSGISLHSLIGMWVMVPKHKYKKKTVFEGTHERDGDIEEKFGLMPAQSSGNNFYDKLTKQGFLRRCKSFSVIDFLSLSLLQNAVFCNICIGQSFVNFSDLCFFMLQPMLMFQNGFNKDEVALCISIGAGADLAGRCSLAMLSSILSVNIRLLYYCATALTMLGRIALLQATGLVPVTAVTAVLGVLRAWLHIASPLVVAVQVSTEDFPGAYGLFLLSWGLVSLACNPLIGIIRDVYEDYTPAFYGLAVCCLPCIIMWPIEYFLSSKEKRQSDSDV